MATALATTASAARDRQWYIVGRWQEYEGEARANLLRVVAVGVLYAVQLVNFYVLKTSSRGFHQQATLLAVGWTLLALAVLVCQRRRVFPEWLKYASTVADIALLTAAAHLAGGPKSPVVAAYFLILGLASLRFSVGLIWAATLGCLLGYEVVVGGSDSKWFDSQHTTPVAEQLTMLATLALTGIVLGQVVRRVRGLAEEFQARVARAET